MLRLYPIQEYVKSSVLSLSLCLHAVQIHIQRTFTVRCHRHLLFTVQSHIQRTFTRRCHIQRQFAVRCQLTTSIYCTMSYTTHIHCTNSYTHTQSTMSHITTIDYTVICNAVQSMSFTKPVRYHMQRPYTLQSHIYIQR